ncbi:MAG: hypothetical protein CML20_15940 [Rheinheimera sp.]|nr:hypothetical protein [Rheinheimera sp.]
MKLLFFILTVISYPAFSKDFTFIKSPVSVHLKSECKSEACNVILCMKNFQDKSITISSLFLSQDQLLINGMLFYSLENYIEFGSDIYSPWLDRGKMTDFFKEKFLKSIDASTKISFESGEEKCFNLNLDKSYVLEDGNYYIGHYILRDAYLQEGEDVSLFSVSSNIIVIQK